MGKRYLVIFGSILFFVLGGLSSVFAVEITADMVTKEGKITRSGKIYVKGNKYRVEKGSTPMYTIVRGDKGLLWQINGAEKTYVDVKLAPSMKPKVDEKFAGEVSRKQVGQETIDGRAVKKYEVLVQEGGKKETYYQWWAADVGFPVRVAAGSGKWTVDYKNIKKGAVPDSLFDLPQGSIKEATESPDVLH